MTQQPFTAEQQDILWKLWDDSLPLPLEMYRPPPGHIGTFPKHEMRSGKRLPGATYGKAWIAPEPREPWETAPDPDDFVGVYLPPDVARTKSIKACVKMLVQALTVEHCTTCGGTGQIPFPDGDNTEFHFEDCFACQGGTTHDSEKMRQLARRDRLAYLALEGMIRPPAHCPTMEEWNAKNSPYVDRSIQKSDFDAIKFCNKISSLGGRIISIFQSIPHYSTAAGSTHDFHLPYEIWYELPPDRVLDDH